MPKAVATPRFRRRFGRADLPTASGDAVSIAQALRNEAYGYDDPRVYRRPASDRPRRWHPSLFKRTVELWSRELTKLARRVVLSSD